MPVGFSVSGSAAIIFAAMFIAFGMFHSAATNGFEEVTDAQEDRTDRMLERQNTEIAVVSATYDPDRDDGNLTVQIDNAGATDLAVDEVDLLAGNEYIVPDETSVDGDEATTLWLPTERLVLIRTGLDSDPGQVKVVTGTGVADVEPTEAI